MQMMQPREGTPLRELGRRYVGLPSGQWTHWLAVGQCLWLWPWLLAVSRGAFPGRGREKKTLLVKGTSVLVRRKTRVESKVRTGAAGEPLKNKKTAYIMVASDIGQGNFVIGGRPCIYCTDNIPCGHGRPRGLKGTADVGRERFSQNRP